MRLRRLFARLFRRPDKIEIICSYSLGAPFAPLDDADYALVVAERKRRRALGDDEPLDEDDIAALLGQSREPMDDTIV